MRTSRTSKKRRTSKRRTSKRRTSKRRTSRKRRTSKRRTSRKISRKRKFGTKITDEYGNPIPEISEVKNIEDKGEKIADVYTNYFKILIKYLEYIKRQIKDHSFKIKLGTLLISVFLLLYSSKGDIIAKIRETRNKKPFEIMQDMYVYLFSGTLLGQQTIKDGLYEVFTQAKNTLTYDAELEEITVKFQTLVDNNLVDADMIELFKDMRKNDLSRNQSGDYKFTSEERSNIRSFMKLLIKLSISHKKEMNTDLSEEYIKDLIDKLGLFIKDYGDAKEKLDSEVVNPLLLNMLGEHGTPHSAILLVGNPGVGKTRFVKELAKNIKARIYEYTTDKDNYDPIVNKSYEEQYPKLDPFIRMKIENEDNKPIIFFIDEIDKKINSKYLFNMLLSLLGDPKERKVTEGGWGIQIKIPANVIIICASNHSLEEIVNMRKDKMYEPLKSRFVEIFIPDMAKDIQMKVITEYLKEIHPGHTYEDKEFFENIVFKTNYSGMRELFTIANTYVKHYRSIKLLEVYKDVVNMDEYRKNYLKLLDDEKERERIKKAKKSPSRSPTSPTSSTSASTSPSSGTPPKSDEDGGDGDGDGDEGDDDDGGEYVNRRS